MYKSIVVSCDTYYYMLANEPTWTRCSLHRLLGFGITPASTSKSALTGDFCLSARMEGQVRGKVLRASQHRPAVSGDPISATASGTCYQGVLPDPAFDHELPMIVRPHVVFTPQLSRALSRTL